MDPMEEGAVGGGEWMMYIVVFVLVSAGLLIWFLGRDSGDGTQDPKPVAHASQELPTAQAGVLGTTVRPAGGQPGQGLSQPATPAPVAPPPTAPAQEAAPGTSPNASSQALTAQQEALVQQRIKEVEAATAARLKAEQARAEAIRRERELPGAGEPEQLPARCRNERIAERMQELIRLCEGQRLCTNPYQDQRFLAKLDEIYDAMAELPFTMVWYESGKSQLSATDTKRLENWFRQTWEDHKASAPADDLGVAYFMFGSSSPGGSAKLNYRLGGERTEALYSAYNGMTKPAGMSEDVSIRKTNIGPDTVAGGYCDRMPAGHEARRVCDTVEASDHAGKSIVKQAGLVLAYPSDCVAVLMAEE